ncbi:unnamed protein product [Coffea canephora]|uniref:Uncharacterized protein n=1 Tax=Coffea canephora TaxID=49390 RepID=A0A068U8F3_COFCA|nr:unnamed protein product [Coffea canephora]
MTHSGPPGSSSVLKVEPFTLIDPPGLILTIFLNLSGLEPSTHILNSMLNQVLFSRMVILFPIFRRRGEVRGARVQV